MGWPKPKEKDCRLKKKHTDNTQEKMHNIQVWVSHSGRTETCTGWNTKGENQKVTNTYSEALKYLKKKDPKEKLYRMKMQDEVQKLQK